MSEKEAGASSSSKAEPSAAEPTSDSDGEATLTMVDVLRQEHECEEQDVAVYGDSDMQQCTYESGYVKRQALYSCLTCCPESRNDATKRCGICVACCMRCHENHKLIELFTKRNFRCDCGSAKMPGITCALQPNKAEPNTNNEYNQNFGGVYCSCERPYPDPECDVTEEMYQCCVCEDWWHGSHLKAIVPKENNFSEVICEGCMQKHQFLQSYVGLSIKGQKSDDTVENAEADPTVHGNNDQEDNPLENELNRSVEGIISINNANECEEPVAKKQKTDDELSGAIDNDVCKCILSNELHKYEGGATFWPSKWRQSLCKCAKCMKMYADNKVEYLLDEDDTTDSYHQRGKSKNPDSRYELGMKALSALGHTRQIDAITGYNQMKQKLMEYLQSFVVNRRTVTEDDIKSFFSDMTKK